MQFALYVDDAAEPVGTGTVSDSANSGNFSNGNFQWGSRHGGIGGGMTQGYGCCLDDFRVYLAALTTAQVKNIVKTFQKQSLWGNTGNAAVGGVLTKGDQANYSADTSWTVDFSDTTGMALTEIGSSGSVTISSVSLASRTGDLDASLVPGSVTLTQGGVSYTSSAPTTDTTIDFYTPGKAVGTSRHRLLFTFSDEVKFDTAASFTLTVNKKAGSTRFGIGLMQPANTTMGGSFAPMLEIAGVYVETIAPRTFTAELTGTNRWSELAWSPALPEKLYSFDTLQITASGEAPTLLLDALYTTKAKVVLDGPMRVGADDTLYEDGCWQKTLLAAAGITVSGGGAVLPLKSGFVGVYTMTDTTLALRAQNKEVISINFARGYSQTGTDYAGLAPVQGNTWNNLTDTWSGADTTKDLPALVATADGSTTSASAITGTWGCYTFWSYANGVTDNFLKGYLDDGGNHARFTLENIPYSKYDVIIYCATDSRLRFTAPTVNGTQYTCGADGVAYAGSATWGATKAPSAQFGVNAMILKNLRTASLSVNGGLRSGNNRGGIAAVQIVCTGERAGQQQDYTATIAESTAFDDIAWEGGKTLEEGTLNTATITVGAGEGEVDIDFGSGAQVLKTVKIISSRDMRITADEALANVGTLDVSECSAKVTSNWPVLSLASSETPKWDYAGGSAAGSSIAIAHNGGVLNITGGTWSFVNSANATATTVNMTDVSATYADCFGIGTATYTVGGDSSVTTPTFVLSDAGRGRTSVFTLKDAAVITVTGDTIQDSNQNAVMFGHWDGPSTFTIRDDARFVAADTQILVGKTSNSQTINVDGGTIVTKGIKAAGYADGPNTLNLSGGTLVLGEVGISSYADNRTILVNVTEDSTIAASAATLPISQPIDIAAGKTLTIDANGAVVSCSSAITGSGNIVINDTSATGDGSVAFTGDRSGFTGTITYRRGAYDIGAVRTFTQPGSGVVLEAGVSLAATQTLAEYGSGRPVTITGLEDGMRVTLNKLDGTRTSLTAADGQVAFPADVPKIDGDACLFDITFTNYVWDMSHQIDGCIAYKVLPTARLQYDSLPTFANTNAEAQVKDCGVYIRHHPYINKADTVFTGLGDFTAVFVGEMSATTNRIFVHFGSSVGSNQGILITTLAEKDKVGVFSNAGSALTELTTLSVPNAATARHVYIVTKREVAGDTVFTIYLDGIKRAEKTLAGTFVLGATGSSGVQVGADFGGALRSRTIYKAVDNVETETGVLNVCRIYDYTLSQTQVTALTTEYPYESEGGLYTRTVEGAVGYSAVATWAKSPSETLAYAEPTGTETFLPSATITASEAATIAVNADAALETLTLNGAAMSFVKDDEGTNGIAVATAVVNAPVTVEYGAIDLSGATVSLNEGSLTFDFDGFDLSDRFYSERIQVTGLTEESDAIKAINLPSSAGRTVTFGYDDGYYYLFVTVEEGPFVYGSTGWTWNGEPVSAATVSNHTDIAVVCEADLEWPADRSTFIVSNGTFKVSTAPVVTCAITVEAGAKLDLNGIKCWNMSVYFDIVLNGGELTNTSEVQATFKGLTLTRDSFVDVPSEGEGLSLQSSAGSWADITVDMNGHTLTKRGGGMLVLVNAHFEGGGEVYVTEGVLYSSETTVFGDTVLRVGEDGIVSQRVNYGPNPRTLDVGKIIGEGGTLNIIGTITNFTLEGTITLDAFNHFNTITMSDGAVLNAGQNRNLSLAGAGTVNVVLTDAEIAGGAGVTVFTPSGEATTTFGKVTDSNGNVVSFTSAGGVITIASDNDCITFASAGRFTLKTANLAKNWDVGMQWSTDKVVWTEWNGEEVSAAQKGGAGNYNLYVRGDENTVVTGNGSNYRWVLIPTGNYKIFCTGNIETLRGATGDQPSATHMASYCYCCMFCGCTSLASAPELPATTLASWCCRAMFAGCRSLTVAPELPATALAEHCYGEMFSGCTSLTAAPEITATKLSHDCCWGMFRGCTSLTVAPSLPATTLEQYCYAHMFENCMSLTTVPTLSATTLAVCCYDGMFSGCTSLTSAPELPATTLAGSCYRSMFSGCTSLTSAPELPATTLARSCYYEMFKVCTGIKMSKTTPGKTWSIPSNATTADSWNTSMFAGTGGSFTNDPEVGVTYYIQSAVATIAPQAVEHATFKVYTNEVEVAAPYTVIWGETVKVVYTADARYFFAGGSPTAVVEVSAEDGVAIVPAVGLETATAVVGADKYFSTLAAAVVAAKNGDTVRLLKNASGDGIFIGEDRFPDGLIIDLGGFAYTVTGNLVGGVAASQDQALHLGGGNVLSFINGTIAASADAGAMMLVQNYSSLTLTGVTLDGRGLSGSGRYVLSNNDGEILIGSGSQILAKEGDWAFDVCVTAGYEGARVTVDGASITGNVEVSCAAEGGDLALDFVSGTLVGRLDIGSGGDAVCVTKSPAFELDPPDGCSWSEPMRDGRQLLVEAGWWLVDFDLTARGTRNGGGRVLQRVANGGTAVPPTVTAQPDWVFSGWSCDFAAVTNDLTVTALYRTLKADLHVDEVVVTNAATSGDAVAIRWTVGNTGNPGWNGRVTEAIRLVSTTNAAQVVTVWQGTTSLSVPRDGTVEREYVWTIPLKGYDGSWRVVVETAIGASNEFGGNNARTAAEPLVITACPLPELCVVSTSLEKYEDPALGLLALRPGNKATLRYRVKNIGDAPVLKSRTDALYVLDHEDGVADATRPMIRLATWTVAPEDGVEENGSFGSVRAYEITVELPKALGMSGDVRFHVKTDIYDAVAEQNEADEYLADEETYEHPIYTFEEMLFVEPTTPTVAENNSSGVRVKVTRSGFTDQAKTVAVSAGAGLTVPSSVTFAKGSSVATFYAKPVDNALVDGYRTVEINVGEYAADVTIVDNEVPRLSVSLDKATIREGDGTIIATVTRELATSEPLTVYLTGVSSSHCTYPASVVIPANETTVTFEITPVDNDTAEIAANLTLRASANGHVATSVSYVVEDDDVPTVTLELYPEEVSEGAGASASYAILSRTDQEKIGEAITVNLTQSPANQLILQSSVTIPAYTMAVRFPIGVVDNGTDDGDRDVVITGSIYIKSCGCSGQPSSGDVIEATLRVIDNDVPSLTLVASPSTMKEGLAHAGDLILTHNSVLTEDLDVELSFDTANEIDIPTVVTIPAGETQVVIPVRTIDDGVTDGGKLVSVYADDPNGDFKSASAWIQVSDQNLPDLKVAEIRVPTTAVAGKAFDCSVRIANVGFVAAGNDIPYSIHLISGASGGSATASNRLCSGKIAGGISPDESTVIPVTVTAPSTTGDYRLAVVVDAEGTVSELDKANNTLFSSAVGVSAAYTATVSVAEKVYMPGTPVAISGSATLTDGSTAAANVSVDVYVLVNGMRRTYSVKTDATGAFSAIFQPVDGESGHYSIGACYPGLVSSIEQDGFDILGMKRSSTANVIWDISVGDEVMRTVYIKNCSGTELTGIDVAFSSVPEECSVSFAVPETLPANGTVALKLTAKALDTTSQTDYRKFYVRISAAEGVSLQFPVYFHSQSLKGQLEATPKAVDTTMAIGCTRYIDVNILNDGRGDSGAINVTIPKANWLRLVSASRIENLASGESATLTLELSAHADDGLVLNYPLPGASVVVAAENGNAISIPLKITPVSASTGGMRVYVSDNFTANLDDQSAFLAGATITISNPYTGDTVAKATTDSTGIVDFGDLPVGEWTVSVSAPEHDSCVKNVDVNPDRVTSVSAFVQNNIVSLEYEMTATEIEDVYEVKLVLDYDTSVPAPIVKVDGPDFLPEVSDGNPHTFTFVYSNTGLLRAEKVSIQVPTIDGYGFEVFLNEFSLEAGESKSVPIKFYKRSRAMLLAANTESRTVQDDIYAVATIYRFDNTIAYLCRGELQKYPVTKAVTFGEHEVVRIRASEFPNVFHVDDEEEGEPARANDSTYVPSTGSFDDSGSRTGGNLKVDCNMPWWVKTIWALSPGKYVGGIKAAISSYRFWNKVDNAETWKDYAKIAGDWLYNKAKAKIKSEIMGWAGKKAIGALLYGLEKAKWNLACLEFYNKVKNTVLVSPPYEDLWPRSGDMSYSAVPLLMANALAVDNLTGTGSSSIHELSVDSGIDETLLSAIILLQIRIDALDGITQELFPCLDVSKIEDDGIIDDMVVALASMVETGDELSVENFREYLGGAVTEEDLAKCVARWNAGQIDVGAIKEHARIFALTENFVRNEYGAEDFQSFYEGEFEKLYAAYGDGDSSVCASVTLQLSQDVALTREVFDGRLKMKNNLPYADVTNLVLEVVIKDMDGNPCNDRFEYYGNGLDGMKGNDILKGGVTLPAATQGYAYVRFVPKYSAAETSPTMYAFGGTVRYTNPTTGEEISGELIPVNMTVNPSPRLKLDYFVQRDVYGDDPFTDGVEASVPAEMAVLVRNVGAGEARNVTVSSVQPSVVLNEKGLAAEFSMTDYSLGPSALNGETAYLGLNKVSLGTIPVGGSATAQWWLMSTIDGHFAKLAASVMPLNSRNTPDTSLVDSAVGTHKLIRSLKVDGISLPYFLTSEAVDLYGSPDTVYSPDGENESVAMANVEEFSGTLVGSNPRLVIKVSAAEGWNYCFVSQNELKRYTVSSVLRGDGHVIPVQNAWITSKVFRDGLSPLNESRLHIADNVAAASETTYTVTLAAKPTDPPAVVEFDREDAEIILSAFDSLNVTFSTAIDPATFSVDDLVLRKQGVKIDDLSPLSITAADGTGMSYTISGLSALCSGLGRYELIVQCAGVADLNGTLGVSGKAFTWSLSLPDAPYIVSAEGVPVRPVKALDEVTVVMSAPVVASSVNDLVITLNGTDVSAAVKRTAADASLTRFVLSGLSALQDSDGPYTLSVNCSGLHTEAGGVGDSTFETSWTIDNVAPTLISVARQETFAGTTFEICLSETANISIDNVRVTVKGSAPGLPAALVLLPETAVLTPVAGRPGVYAVTGLDSVLQTDGLYTFSCELDGVTDSAGNAASGSKSVSWTVDNTPPEKATDLAVSSAYGSVDTCVYTASQSLNVSGMVPEDGLSVALYSKYAGGDETLLAEPEPDANRRFSADLTLPGAGNMTVIIRLTDAAGQSSDTTFQVYVDNIALDASFSGLPDIESVADAVVLTFSAEPTEASVLAAPLALTRNGEAVEIPNAALTKVSALAYSVSGLAEYTADYGDYELSCDLSGVAKTLSGLTGGRTVSAFWSHVQLDTVAPTVAAVLFDGEAAVADYVQMFSSVAVRFSESVNVPDLIARDLIGQALFFQVLDDENAVLETVRASGVTWDESTLTASWTIVPDSIPYGKARLVIEPSLIRDSSGNALETTDAFNVISTSKNYTPSDFMQAAAAESACPTLFDYNNDGLLDLFVGEKASDTVGKVRIYLNRGTKTNPVFSDWTYLKRGTEDVELAAAGCAGAQVSFLRSRNSSSCQMVLASSVGEIYAWRYNVLIDDVPAPLELWHDRAMNDDYRPIRTQTFCSSAGIGRILVSGQNSRMFWLSRTPVRDKNNEMVSYRLNYSPLLDKNGNPLEFPEGQSHTAAVMTDVSGDSVLDLVTGDSDGNVWVYYGMGNARFTANSVKIYENTSEVTRSRLAVGDIDGDGIDDILVGRRDGSILKLKGESVLAQAVNFRRYRVKDVEEALSTEMYWGNSASGWVSEQTRDDAQATVDRAASQAETVLTAQFVGAGTLSFSWSFAGAGGSSRYCCEVDGATVLDREDAFDLSSELTSVAGSGVHTVVWRVTGAGKAVLRDVAFIPTDPATQFTTTSQRPIAYKDIRRFANAIWKAKGGDYEATLREVAANGKSVEENCITGIDSSDPDGKFQATIEVVDGVPQVRPSPDLGSERVYTTYGRASLNTGDWQLVTPENKSAFKFFYVTVDLK